MFRQLIELGVVEVNTEPLDAGIEWRLKEFWENTSCPQCGHQSIVTWKGIDRIWCRDCNFKPFFTYGAPFHEKHLSCGEVLLDFTLYADTMLSINQISPFLRRAYRTVYTAIRDVEAAVQRGFPVVWSLLDQNIDEFLTIRRALERVEQVYTYVQAVDGTPIAESTLRALYDDRRDLYFSLKLKTSGFKPPLKTLHHSRNPTFLQIQIYLSG